MGARIIPPPIPKDLRKISNIYVIPLVVHASIQFIGGGALSYFAFQMASSASDILSKIFWFFLMPVGLFFSSNGLYNFSVMAHDGGHGNLNQNLYVSYVMGVVLSSVVPFYAGVSYMVSHWPHHRFTNTEKDPPSLWAANSPLNRLPRMVGFFYSGFNLTTAFFKRAISLFNDDQAASKLKLHSNRDVKRLVALNCISGTAMLAIYTLILFSNPLLFALGIALPYLGFLTICGAFAFLEHGDTKLGFQLSWTHAHPLMTILSFSDNFHLEHHLYPRVQRSKLHKVFRHLEKSGFYDKNSCLIERSLWGSLKLIFRSSYPNFKAELDVTAAEGEDAIGDSQLKSA